MDNCTVDVVYEIKIDWKLGHDTDRWWNQLCADIMEVFGLPGDRYTSHPYEDCMLFRFKSKKDYQLCKILISEKI
jgi:hypothetical protein